MLRVRFGLSVLCFALCCLAAGSGAQEPRSFLANGDFEAGEGGQPPGWSLALYPEQQGADRCMMRSSERAHSGEWSLKVDTQSVLGDDVTLVFNGAVAAEAAKVLGGRLELSGWLHVEPGTALRPIHMRLRCFGPDAAGQNSFIGDVLEVQILGTPGEWTRFRARGRLPECNIATMDLHCGIRPDVVPTVQYLDDIVVAAPTSQPLELRLPRSSMWRDEGMVTAYVHADPPPPEGSRLRLVLVDPQGRPAAEWERPTPGGELGLDLRGPLLPEGRYRLRAELPDAAGAITVEAPLELVASPWEGAPEDLPGGRGLTAGPSAFAAMGTVAPTDLPDEPEPVAATEAGDHGANFAAFARHPFDLGARLGGPGPGELHLLRLFACPGEYESVALSVAALRDRADVTVTAGDLKGEATTIPAACVDVRVVRQIAGLPPFLEKRATVAVPQLRTQVFWLTCCVPPDAPPGFYRSTVTVRRGDGRTTSVPLLLRVLPLKLPPVAKGYGFWWKMDGRWKGYGSEGRSTALEHIRKQFILLRQHGCNMVSWNGMPRMTRANDGTVQLDFEQDHWGHDRYSPADFFRLGKETGFLSPDVPIQYVGAESWHSQWIADSLKLDRQSPEFAAFYAEVCRRVDAWVKQQGYRLAFACVDEIGNSEERRVEALRFYQIAHEAGLLTSVTDNSMHGGVHLMGQPRFDGIIDMRLYNLLTPEMIDSTHASGDHLWLYNLASQGWSGARDRFVYGLLTERCDAEGCAQWAFQWPNGNKDPYEAAAAGENTGYHYALPSPDGPLPTLALAGVREGIDDARYLALLRDGATAFLEDVPVDSTRLGDYLETHDAGSFDTRRWRIARVAMGEGG